MEALRLAVLLLICSGCAERAPAPRLPAFQPPPVSVWRCQAWPSEDPLSLPASAEDIIRWHRVQRERDHLAYDACKGDLNTLRTWVRDYLKRRMIAGGEP